MAADTLVRAIRAALDETERIATEALSHPTRDDGVWRAGSGMDECRVEGIGITIYDEGGHSAEQARHIAANDPAAVLRRVAADREIVERCEQYARWAANDDAPGFQALKSAGQFMLLALARGLGINPETETP